MLPAWDNPLKFRRIQVLPANGTIGADDVGRARQMTRTTIAGARPQ